MGRPKRYATESEKQKAYRERKKTLSGGVESGHAELVEHLGTDARSSNPAAGVNTDSQVSAKRFTGLHSGSSAPPAQNNLPADVLPELKNHPTGISKDKADEVSEARYSTCKNEGLSTSNVAAGKIPPYDKKKYPNRQAWEIAADRAERAIRWAKKFPDRISPDDLKFQALDWQYQNEGLKASCK